MAMILTGSVLLCLPVASRMRECTPFIDCLFTATSSTCVTGLAVFDTWTHWSLFGQLVILFMIQVGGLGFMTVISMFFLFARKQIGLRERKLIMQSAGSLQISGVVRLIKRILIGTLIIELSGALLLFLRFVRDMPAGSAAYLAVFHSISAFCNAGFDIMGKYGQLSFSSYAGDVWVNLVLMALIVTGGLGFFVLGNIFKNKFQFKKFELHTKIALTTTFCLLITGMVLFYFTERNHAFANLDGGKKWLAAMFQSVTTRTAGFYTADMSKLSDPGSIISNVLMFIGGSPGSTAGGIKTTTFAVILAATFSCARNADSTVMFKRSISPETIKQATAIVAIYICTVICSTILICGLESAGIREVLFEVISAIGTVGLSMNLTPTLCTLSRIVIIFLMYAGRIGGLSLVLALAEKRQKVPTNRPVEKILIG